MKSSPKYPLCFLLFLSTLLLPMSSSYVHAYEYPKRTNDGGKDLITNMCQKTPYPSACESDLRSYPQSSKADPKSLILIMLYVVESRFSDSAKYAENMTKSTHDPDIIRGLNTCIVNFVGVVVVDVGSAVYAVKDGEPKSALQALEDAVSETESCKQGFHGKVPPSYSGRIKELQEISANAIALVKTLS